MRKIIFTLIMLISLAWSTVATAFTRLPASVLFEKDSTNVMESQMPQIEVVAEYMRNNPGASIYIGGFTSQNTPKDKVDIITTLRAQNVKKILVERFHVKAENIHALGVGVSSLYKEAWQNETVTFFKP